MPLTGRYPQDKQTMCTLLRTGTGFDLLHRELLIGGRGAGIFFIDGFTRGAVTEKMLEFLTKITPEQLAPCRDTADFMRQFVTYADAEAEPDAEKAAVAVLAGQMGLLVDGLPAVILIDVREYPSRGITEPENDRVLRGSRDGFCETMLFNAAMLRRRIRDARLTLEAVQIGSASRTDVVLCYLDGLRPDVVRQVRDKLRRITIPALNLTQESLAECLSRRQWYNPFPRIRYTERPDAAAAAVLEGRVVILIDNTPSAMILPSGIFDFVQNTNDFYFSNLIHH